MIKKHPQLLRYGGVTRAGYCLTSPQAPSRTKGRKCFVLGFDLVPSKASRYESTKQVPGTSKPEPYGPRTYNIIRKYNLHIFLII